MRVEASNFGRPIPTRKSGFTLIEVLVVVAIIALLVAILLPSLVAARRQAKEMVCKSNLHQIGVASGGYANSHKRGTFPDWWAVGTAAFRPIPNWRDPATGKLAKYGLPDLYNRMKLIPLPSKVWICPLNEREAQYEQTYFWANFDHATQNILSYHSTRPAGTTGGSPGVWWVGDNYNFKPFTPIDERHEFVPDTAERPDNRAWFYSKWAGPGAGSFDVGWRYWHRGNMTKWHSTQGDLNYGWGFNMLYYDLSLGFRVMSKTPVE